MEWRNRRTFWALAVVVLTLASVPSVEWVSSLNDYARLAGVWEPAPLKPTSPSRMPHGSEPSARLRAVDFRFKDRTAKSVELVGDFNAWQPGVLKMRRGEGGVFELTVPMTVGAHKYLFLVDGEPQVDPGAPTADGPEGRRVSVRTVK